VAKKLSNIGQRIGGLKPRLSSGKRADDVYRSAAWRALAATVKTQRGGACVRCGSSDSVAADHIHEVKDGGAPLDAANIQLLCAACHRRKSVEARKTRGG
jgi:5-methylcytosine-specific restriction enzyme A